MATEYEVQLQRIRVLYTKLEILNSSLEIIDEVTGLCSGGNYNFTSNSDIRRTCNLTMILNEKTLPSPTSPFWLNKRFRIYVGIQSLQGDEIKWFNLGTYLIKSPTVSIEVDGNKLSITGVDMVAGLNGDISGMLDTKYKIPHGDVISTVVKNTLVEAGEVRLNIEPTTYVVPYDIEKDAGDSFWSLISELTELYASYEAFYDVNGVFVFRKSSTLYNDSVAWNFEDNDMIIDIQNTISYDNVKNKIKVWGAVQDDGSQPSYTIEVRDSNYPHCPFTIEKLDEGRIRNYVVTEDKYHNTSQCKERAEYEVDQHTNCADSVSLTCVPIYSLDVNQICYINRPDENIEGKYVIDSISCGLSHNDTMTITCHKIYNPVYST